ncbi:hypothetical protein DYB25_000485 [Aphanomyces astaci]|uniref:RING-type domain-containing protein n=1 Tax=Aphanomyces astaci TaxID=112090 RepID=A0A397B3Y0_APHAT|nr:hypothetical protein DYB25_000485 [Aphanomyces astaci]RHY22617.1 hypothetical protein DYB36_001291 [Aphanomyces astaci]RHY48113.1 hypothetical protein DYB30_006018 [Aphanomyces astaci]RHY55818.1 hypothetical protein DYB34_001386 [Aphanomyces astaci]RHY61923.1 hypothetical protein DYB38_004588 [Aphanomyces astaci]
MEAGGDGKAKGRQSKRRNERIRTFYKINNNSITSREELSHEEIAAYVGHIDNKCLARFGVMKLSKYNLNVPCGVSTDNATSMSLLGYAAVHSPQVCLSLLYAGADPSYDCQSGLVIHPESRAMLLRYPIQYIVWIISLLALSISQRHGSACVHCSDDSNHVVQLSPCRHPICQGCFWAHLSLLRIDQDLTCPHCHVDIENAASTCPPRPPPTADAPSTIAQASLDAYLRLSHIPPKGHKNVKPTVEPLPLWRALQLYVGLTPKQRDAEMFKAVVARNAGRLRALVHVGVDVNCRNEYGQTCLFMAAWTGDLGCVEALLASGAAADLADNAGTLPSQCALRHGHHAIASILHQANMIILPCQDHHEDQEGVVANGLEHLHPPTRFVELIPSASAHPGAGSGYFDNVFPDDFLARLDALHGTLPVAPKEKESCSNRSYFCDSLGWVLDGVRRACGRAVFPNMRFLHYTDVGGSLPAHVDLSRTDLQGVTSTKTFIIYLTTCASGGQTNLLTSTNAHDHNVLAAVQPRRGRLLIFPHLCPHEGAVVQHVPKLLLRGEMY